MEKNSDRELTELEEASAKLRASLKQCRDMVGDYRSKLTSGRDEPREGPGAEVQRES